MAIRASIATGNFTAAATWGLVDTTMYAVSDVNSTAVTTAYSNGPRSALFTPGAITVSHIGIRLHVRVDTSGTFTIHLADSANVEIAGTAVTVDVADFPVASVADLNGGWHFFKLAAPVTLLAATQYEAEAKTSVASQINVSAATSGANMSVALITTTTGAPAAGDDLIIFGEKTGQGTGNAFTVTMNNTATTDFGAASNLLIAPAIAICDGGTLQSGVAAATAYLLKVSGHIIVYSDGTLNIGTSGTPVPSGGSSFIEFDCTVNVDFGLTVRNGGTWNAYGTKGFTASPLNHYTLLTADEAAAQTVIGPLLDTTGWQAGDELCFASTTTIASQAELKVISTVDSATQVTLTAGLTYAHSGTNGANGDIRCEIGNITRNVGIRGASATLQTYVDIKATAIVTLRKAAFKWMGSVNTIKRGFDVGTTTGTFDVQLCSFTEFSVASSVAVFLTGTTGGGTIIFSDNVVYNISTGLSVAATSGTWTINNNIFIRTPSNQMAALNDVGGVFTNNRISCATSSGLTMTEVNAVIGTFSGNEFHATANDSGLRVNGTISGDILNCRFYRNTTGTGESAGLYILLGGAQPSGPLTVTNLIAFGNSATGVTVATGVVRLISPNIQAGVTYVCPVGLKFGSTFNGTLGSGPSEVTVENGLIGTVSTHSTGDLSVSQFGNAPRCVLHNTTLGSTVEVATPDRLGFGSYIASLKHDTTAGNHKTWKVGGRATGGASLETDTVRFNTSSPSLRLYPGSATIKLESSTWEAAVSSGNTLTPSVRVRCSTVGSGDAASYNGAVRPRLIVRRNVAAGIAADTVLATASASSDGAFELISGTTAAVTDDAILEFFVDCEGTAGFANVDDFSCVGADPNGMKYWSPQHAGPLALALPAGGVGGIKTSRGMNGGMVG